MSTPKSDKPFVIVRCRNAGVHAGELVERNGTEVTIEKGRRIWYWSGAASLSELAVYGARNVGQCKFGLPVSRVELLDACELLYCSEAAIKMITECPPWRA